MLNHGVLDLDARLPGLGRTPLLTTPFRWALETVALRPMFDDAGELRREFFCDGRRLTARGRAAGAACAAAAPFLMVFLLVHFAFKHLERVYHHPSSLGARPALTCVYVPERMRVQWIWFDCHISCRSLPSALPLHTQQPGGTQP